MTACLISLHVHLRDVLRVHVYIMFTRVCITRSAVNNLSFKLKCLDVQKFCCFRKYLRDSERAIFAKEAFDLCFDVINDLIPSMQRTTDQLEQEKFLLDVHRLASTNNVRNLHVRTMG